MMGAGGCLKASATLPLTMPAHTDMDAPGFTRCFLALGFVNPS